MTQNGPDVWHPFVIIDDAVLRSFINPDAECATCGDAKYMLDNCYPCPTCKPPVLCSVALGNCTCRDEDPLERPMNADQLRIAELERLLRNVVDHFEGALAEAPESACSLCHPSIAAARLALPPEDQ